MGDSQGPTVNLPEGNMALQIFSFKTWDEDYPGLELWRGGDELPQPTIIEKKGPSNVVKVMGPYVKT